MGYPFALPVIAGSLTNFVDVDVFAYYFASAQTLTSFQPAVLDAPSGDTVKVDLRTATGGGGSGLSATIPDGGYTPATAVTGSVAIAAGTTMYLRVTAEGGGALTLYGNFEVDVAAAAQSALTTLARCKSFRNISGSSNDDTLNTIIAGVSAKMQSYMRRTCALTAYTSELHDASGNSDTITLDEYPIATSPALAMTYNGTTVDTDTYDVDTAAGQVIQVASGAATNWAKGRRAYSFDYTAGYSAIPEDIQHWATKQAVHEFQQTEEGGSRLGNRGETLDAGGDAQYLTGQWAQGVLDAMAPWVNRRHF